MLVSLQNREIYQHPPNSSHIVDRLVAIILSCRVYSRNMMILIIWKNITDTFCVCMSLSLSIFPIPFEFKSVSTFSKNICTIDYSFSSVNSSISSWSILLVTYSYRATLPWQFFYLKSINTVLFLKEEEAKLEHVVSSVSL